MEINNLIQRDDVDPYLYNLNITMTDENIKKFCGIKYVCMQGSPVRAKEFARKITAQILKIDMDFFEPVNLTKTTAFHCYRVGNILSVSHGMGNPSILTLLHNISKIMYLAENFEVEYIRIGTSGGIGVEPGSVVLTESSYMPNLVAGFQMFPLGKDVIYPTQMDAALNKRIIAAQPNHQSFNVLTGNSIAADDFYMGQARFDGLLRPKYDDKKRMEYFKKIQSLNILNFEMESTALAAFCNRARIPATMIAVTLLNRLQGDQITATSEVLAEYSDRSQSVAINYLISQIK